MDTARAVSMVSSRAVLALLPQVQARERAAHAETASEQEEDAEADSLALAIEPQVLKLLKKRSNISCVSFPEVTCTLALDFADVNTGERNSMFLTIFTCIEKISLSIATKFLHDYSCRRFRARFPAKAASGSVYRPVNDFLNCFAPALLYNNNSIKKKNLSFKTVIFQKAQGKKRMLQYMMLKGKNTLWRR